MSPSFEYPTGSWKSSIKCVSFPSSFESPCWTWHLCSKPIRKWGLDNEPWEDGNGSPFKCGRGLSTRTLPWPGNGVGGKARKPFSGWTWTNSNWLFTPFRPSSQGFMSQLAMDGFMGTLEINSLLNLISLPPCPLPSTRPEKQHAVIKRSNSFPHPRVFWINHC